MASFLGFGDWMQSQLGAFGIKGQLAILFVVFFVDAVFFPMLPEAFVLYFWTIFPTIDTRFSPKTDLVVTALVILATVLLAEVVANYFLYTLMRRALRSSPPKRALRPNRAAMLGLGLFGVGFVLPWVSIFVGTTGVHESLFDLLRLAAGFTVGGAQVILEEPSAATVRLTLALSLFGLLLGAIGVWSKRARAAAVVAFCSALLVFTDLLAQQFGQPVGVEGAGGGHHVIWGPSLGFGLAIVAVAMLSVSFQPRFDVPLPEGQQTWWAKHNLQTRLMRAMNKWRDFLVVSDERIVLVNRLVPVMPFMGAFMAVSPWNRKKAMVYLVVGGFLKYGALLALVGYAGAVFDPASTWKFTLALLAIILGVSLASQGYVRKRMQREAQAAAAGAEDVPPDDGPSTDAPDEPAQPPAQH